MFIKIAAKLFGTSNERMLKKLSVPVQKINELEDEWSKLSDQELAAKTLEFRQREEQGESLDSILPEAFATVREAAKRTLGQRHHDVQLIGGMILHQGNISERESTT